MKTLQPAGPHNEFISGAPLEAVKYTELKEETLSVISFLRFSAFWLRSK